MATITAVSYTGQSFYQLTESTCFSQKISASTNTFRTDFSVSQGTCWCLWSQRVCREMIICWMHFCFMVKWLLICGYRWTLPERSTLFVTNEFSSLSLLDLFRGGEIVLWNLNKSLSCWQFQLRELSTTHIHVSFNHPLYWTWLASKTDLVWFKITQSTFDSYNYEGTWTL